MYNNYLKGEKMKLKYVFFLLTFFAIPFFPTTAQYIATYSGIVKDTADQPIENVLVYARGMFADYSSDSVYTDENGKFVLGFPSLSGGGVFLYTRFYFEHFEFRTLNITRYISIGENDGGVIILVSNTSPEFVTVSGSIKFENNTPVPSGRVSFYNTYTDDFYQAITNAEGNFSLEVKKGFFRIDSWVQYKLGDNWTYKYLCYVDNEDSTKCALLAVFEVIDSINFIYPNLNIGTISGTVRDAATQQPIQNAFITVTSSELTDSTFIGTDANGNYAIDVFEGEYFLRAYQSGYLIQYYKNVYNLFDAAPVIVNEDSLQVTGIDFDMEKPVPGSNTISGDVISSWDDYGAGVHVYAIPLAGGNWVETKSELYGNFTISNLKNGDYILLFYKEGFLSEFYQNTVEWEEAIVITLTGNQHVNNLYMTMTPLNTFGGAISGKISTGSGSLLSGTLISAENFLGEVISNSLSIYNGTYKISSLGNGGYTIKASKIGYVTSEYSEEIQIDLSSQPVVNGVDITIITTGIKEDENAIPESFKLSQNYPNPFNPTTKIKFSIPSNQNPLLGGARGGLVTLKVYDVLGNEVSTLVNEQKSPGEYEVEFNGSNLSSGIYFYQLKSGSYVQINKMILLR
jgi:hypothetical protein